MKHIFIVNPVAGKGNSEETLVPQIKNFVKSADFEYEIHRSLNKAEIGSYCKQRAAKGDAVRFYACGGDGTINDVANGIVGYENAELAIIPCGSGNDFARNFTDKSGFFDINRQIHGSVIDVDIIRMITDSGNVSYAMNMLNIGKDCDVVVECQEMKRLPGVHGSLAYALGACKVLPDKRLYKLRYEFEGETVTVDVMLCAVANGAFCGGGFHNCPNASLVDGLMDVSVVYPITGAKLIQMLLKYRKGTHIYDKDADKYVKCFQTDKFRLEPLTDVNVSIDGECSLFEATTFEVVPKAIKFVVPEGCEMI